MAEAIEVTTLRDEKEGDLFLEIVASEETLQNLGEFTSYLLKVLKQIPIVHKTVADTAQDTGIAMEEMECDMMLLIQSIPKDTWLSIGNNADSTTAINSSVKRVFIQPGFVKLIMQNIWSRAFVTDQLLLNGCTLLASYITIVSDKNYVTEKWCMKTQ
ncbi:unnamed protein product [Owenia fusiformis]|uniref:Uncharacterized protein n=1 Tax=Owenia fusiformis TaxID=6347 RepID=A0A8J1U8M8_OWEFU|nr:unnamed protein product [Owenia fusiformis]